VRLTVRAGDDVVKAETGDIPVREPGVDGEAFLHLLLIVGVT
jgi:hypothetical protein